MTNVKFNGVARREKLVPKRTMSQEEITQWYAERATFRQRCQEVFNRVQPGLIKTHYNWYMAVEPDSGNYFLDKDELVVVQIAHQKHPNTRMHVFRINETGICGTI